MPAPSPNPFDDDDVLAEALADAWIEQARTSPAIRREALRAVGLLNVPRSLQAVADNLGISKSSVSQIQAIALAKARREFIFRFPDLV
jgi:DNA-directed RNA polymerase sigma subunit (sigma70/sigma32)